MPEIPELQIVYQHKGILVVNKPHGLASQPTQCADARDVYSLLQQKYPYVGLHHRLDQPASGLLLLCTDRALNAQLSRSFQQRRIARGYITWVVGTPPDEGIWRFKLNGQKAISAFQTVYKDEEQAVLAVQLHTGRTHQIRRHASQAGHPIVGDRRYGGIAGALWPRLALHAMHLRFVHPATQQPVELTTAIPKDLIGVLGETVSQSIQSRLHSSIYPNNFNC